MMEYAEGGSLYNGKMYTDCTGKYVMFANVTVNNIYLVSLVIKVKRCVYLQFYMTVTFL